MLGTRPGVRRPTDHGAATRACITYDPGRGTNCIYVQPGPLNSRGPKGHQDRLSDLGILSIERDRFSEIVRHGILMSFAHSKAQGVKI